MFSLQFKYNSKGRGDLVLFDDSDPIRSWTVRTGSVHVIKGLINPIPVGLWKILVPSVKTSEKSMVVDGIGWKIRLYTWEAKFTHYLIHPDGNLPGSMGCIVTPRTAALPLRDKLDDILKIQDHIPLDVVYENS